MADHYELRSSLRLRKAAAIEGDDVNTDLSPFLIYLVFSRLGQSKNYFGACDCLEVIGDG